VGKHLINAGAKIEMAELEALGRPKWGTSERGDTMLELV
jgi:hypothetical protein